MTIVWKNTINLNSRSYTCGFCGNPLAANQGYSASDVDAHFVEVAIYICHHCKWPTFFIFKNGYLNQQVPSPAFGNAVSHLPDDIKSLYDEARNCLKVNASTASILCSRKLLMNIAVANGAEEGLKFIEYVNYLVEKGFVPPNGRGWVDHIRNKGNEATHEIKIMSRSDAEELITFLEMLLKFIYEFPAKIKDKTQESLK